jgi:site-specific recombinase XerD
VNNGIDLYVVKEWFGHSTINVTEKYAHLAPQKLAEAVAALEN